MTREERLYSMRTQDLANVADKFGIKIKSDTDKSEVIKAILAAEAKESNEILNEKMETRNEEPKLVPMPGTEDPNWGEKHYKSEDTVNNTSFTEEATATQKSKRKRNTLIPYNGKSQTITQWSKELNISVKTLYGRLYELNWPVEKAFTYSRSKKSK